MGIKRTVLIRQIDLWGSEPLESNKIMKKTEMSIFSFVFLDKCLCKKNRNLRHSSGPRISISFFASGHLNPTALFWPWSNYFYEKNIFQQTLLIKSFWWLSWYKDWFNLVWLGLVWFVLFWMVWFNFIMFGLVFE